MVCRSNPFDSALLVKDQGLAQGERGDKVMKNLKIILLTFIFAFFTINNIISNPQRTKKSKQDPILENHVNLKYDSQRKMAESKNLVRNAIKHFKKTSNDTAINDFIYTPMWRKGELFVFVIDETGDILAHGDDFHLLWTSIAHIKTYGDVPLIKELLTAAPEGTEIGFLWNNAYKQAFVATVVKDGVKYVIGTGFYPQDSDFTVRTLVASAVNYFNTHGKDKLVEMINNPYGPYIKGDITLQLLDMEGNCYADGDNEANVGQNLIDYVDSKGTKYIQEIINLAKHKGHGWVEHTSYEAPKRDFVERVTDKKHNKDYIIVGGFYPSANFEATKNLVKKAAAYLKTHGTKDAFRDFNSPTQESEFYYGALGIFAVTPQGIVKANGYDPYFIGQNWFHRKDGNGNFYVKEMIQRAMQYGSAIVTYYDLNVNLVAYVELVDTVEGKFIIGSRYRPDSKDQSVSVLVDKARNHLLNNDTEQSFNLFSTVDGGYYEGDMYIFVYDTIGTRFVNGTHKSQIWQNFIKSVDQEGKAVVKQLIDIGNNGGGWLQYKIRNANRKIYVKPVTKPNKLGKLQTYIVGSGYFL